MSRPVIAESPVRGLSGGWTTGRVGSSEIETPDRPASRMSYAAPPITHARCFQSHQTDVVTHDEHALQPREPTRHSSMRQQVYPLGTGPGLRELARIERRGEAASRKFKGTATVCERRRVRAARQIEMHLAEGKLSAAREPTKCRRTPDATKENELSHEERQDRQQGNGGAYGNQTEASCRAAQEARRAATGRSRREDHQPAPSLRARENSGAWTLGRGGDLLRMKLETLNG